MTASPTSPGSTAKVDGPVADGPQSGSAGLVPTEVAPLDARPLTVLRDLVVAVIFAAVVSTLTLVAVDLIDWPAFGSSNVSRASTTAAQIVGILALAGCLVLLWRGPGRIVAGSAKIVAVAALSAITSVTLALPLGSTKLYLGGISVDQQFRTEYLTRLTDSAALHDMTYADLPPFYPAGWFWLGGRYANATGLAGWEAFKPFSILSLTVAVAIALVLWSRILSPARALGATLASALFLLMYASTEPYGAVIAMVLPPAMIILWIGLRAGQRGALAAAGIFLGVAASFYTLYFALALFAAVALAVGAWRFQVPLRTLLGRILIVAAPAVLVALLAWSPFLLEVASDPSGTLSKAKNGGSAFHYLPALGSQLPTPFFQFSLVGVLSLIGLVWMVTRFPTSAAAQALGITVAACYLWCLLSMLATVAGTTLLGFRIEPVLLVTFAAAGAIGVVDFAAWVGSSLGEGPFGRTAACAGIVAALGAIAVAQHVPVQLAGEVTIAYTDTDGDGVRADRRDPGAEGFYPEVDRVIGAQHPGPRNNTVVLTADYGLLAVYPYLGFQALTSHYANPLAEFNARADTIAGWARSADADALRAAIAASPWRAPDTFVFRVGETDAGEPAFTLRLAEDTYPNDPNVRRYTVAFPQHLFDSGYARTDVGPFVVITRVAD